MVGVKVSISKTTIEYADSENGGGDHGGESSESMVPPSPCPPFLPPWLRWLAALAIGCVSHQCKERKKRVCCNKQKRKHKRKLTTVAGCRGVVIVIAVVVRSGHRLPARSLAVQAKALGATPSII